MPMTEQEALKMAVKVTDYCYVLAQAWWGTPATDGIVLERIFTRERGVEEIRFAWWSNGRQAMRPADLDAVDWVDLFTRAVAAGVFNDTEQLGMLRALMNPAQ